MRLRHGYNTYLLSFYVRGNSKDMKYGIQNMQFFLCIETNKYPSDIL